MGRQKKKKEIRLIKLKKECPVCDSATIRYDDKSNTFRCLNCDFHCIAEDFYGCTYLRGHLRLQSTKKAWEVKKEKRKKK
jgi:ribosomal protein S27E